MILSILNALDSSLDAVLKAHSKRLQQQHNLHIFLIFAPSQQIDIISYQLMKKIFLVALALAVATNSLYTSSYWTKKGIDVTDGILQPTTNDQAIYLQTSCSDVDLSVPPYNHNGAVMSGYLNVKGKAGSGLAFIFYGKEGAAKANLKSYPTIIWLNGGPGSSSQLGNFMELGPHFIKPTQMAPYQIVKNNYTWIKEYNVIFVDQPVGTGLSYADPNHPNPYCKDMDEVAADFYGALNELYNNPKGCFSIVGITGDMPLFVFGESYAGKYAPAIAAKIKDEQTKNNGFLKGLKGVGIGDGFTHPYFILTQVGQYAYNLGLIDYQERSYVERLILNATYQERIRDFKEMHNTFDQVLDLIVDLAGGVNVYDITSYKQYPTLILQSFFDSPDVKNRFKLNPGIVYSSQSGNVYEGLFTDFMRQYVRLVEQLLQYNVNVMIYNGQNDLIVQTPGTFKWVEWLHYDKADQFRDTLFTPWKVNGRNAGFYKTVGNLELRTVNDAGHLVPMDQGEWALDMVKGFVTRSL